MKYIKLIIICCDTRNEMEQVNNWKKEISLLVDGRQNYLQALNFLEVIKILDYCANNVRISLRKSLLQRRVQYV